MKKVNFLFLAFSMLLLVVSCGKDDTDIRDEYVGTYDITYDCVGNGVYNTGDQSSYDYFFLVKKGFDDDGIEFENIEGLSYATISGSDFVDSQFGQYAGYFTENRIVFTQFEPGGAGFSRDCGASITAYKR